MDKIKYKKNYLTGVIVRIDFAIPLPNLEKGLPPELSKTILKSFPILEPQKLIQSTFKININSSEKQNVPTKQITIWNYYGKNREKTLSIGEMHFYIEYKAYNRFEDLKEEFFPILTSFFKEFKEAQVSRLGLRYINNVEINETNPTDWTKYINKKLLSLLTLPSTGEKLTRAFNNLSILKDDCNLIFQFGIHNPDYPAPIKKKIFILDLDSYYQGSQEYTDIVGNIENSHALIQEYFERSITEDLRKLMNNE